MPSPIDLGAYAWWRCDQGITLDGSNRVLMWDDSISGLTLGQQTASARPGLTNGRFTTTAVNFDLAGTPLRGLYLIHNKDITQPDSGAAFKFLHNPKLSYHVIVIGRFTGINGNADQFRTLLTTGPVNGIGSPINTSGVGFLFGQDNTGNLQKIVAQTYSRTGIVLNSTSAANAWDATYTPGSLVEACYEATTVPKKLETLANYALTSTGNDVGGADNSNSAYGLLVGCQAGTVTDQTNYKLQWYGYIEDIIVFNTKCLTPVEEQQLYDYFAELRGDPRAIYNLNGSNITTSFAPSGAVNLTRAVSGNVASSFTPSGTIQDLIQLEGGVTSSFAVAGLVELTASVEGSVSTNFSPSGAVQLDLQVQGDAASSFSLATEVEQELVTTGSVSTSFAVTTVIQAELAVFGSVSSSFEVATTTEQEQAVVGDASFAFDSSGTSEQVHACVGDASCGFDGSGYLHEINELDGDVLYSWTLAGSVVEDIVVEGASSLNFNVQGNTYQDFELTADASFAFAPSATATEDILFSEDIPFTFVWTDGVEETLRATGDVAVGFDVQGNTYQDFQETADVSSSFSLSGGVYLDLPLSGEVTSSFEVAGSVVTLILEGGDAAVAFDTSGTTEETMRLVGGVPFGFVVEGDLLTNALSGILLGSGDVTGSLASDLIFGGQLKGVGILEDPYDVLFSVTFEGAGSVSAIPEKDVILRTLPLSGSGTVSEWVPLPLIGHGDLLSYLDVTSVPVTCPCLCPPKLLSFQYGQMFQPQDLALCVLDAAGQHYAPPSITYTLYQVVAGGQKVVVGPYRRTPSQQSLGTYYATGVAGEQGQPGEWRIVWRYVGQRGPVEVEQPFLVTATEGLSSCGCAPSGW